MDSTLFNPKNEGIQIQLRYYRDSLAISGGMVIVMSIWDIIKLFIGFFLGEDTIEELVETAVHEGGIAIIGTDYESLIRILMWVLILLMLSFLGAVIFLYHLYIGLNAYKEGRQTVKKRKRLYLVLTLLSTIFTGLIIMSNILVLFSATNTSANVDFAFLIMEVTAFINYIFILYSSEIKKRIICYFHDPNRHCNAVLRRKRIHGNYWRVFPYIRYYGDS